MGTCCQRQASNVVADNAQQNTLKTFQFPTEPIYAVCILESSEKREVFGYVYFKQIGDKVKIKAKVKGLSKGKHGFHIHEYGNLSQGCKSAGAHFNPTKVNHGGQTSNERHVGDLGNINNDKGSSDFVEYDIEDKLVGLCGPNSVIGRSCVVHQDEDDLGLGGFEDSKTTGHAGARVACGVIGLSDKFSFEF